LPSPDCQFIPAFAILVGKEWRDVLAGHAFWVLLLLLSPLVGYSYVQAVGLYAEASRSAIQFPEVARNLSPLDGIFVPTFGALYLANTFLLPFVVIRAIGSEKQTGSLKLLLQLPCPLSTVLAAKLVVLAAVWMLIAAPCLSAVALWALAGAHVGIGELTNLVLGHFLYGAVVTGIALIAAAITESAATAAILALSATLGFWVLDFAAAGESGLLKAASSLSLTTLLRNFEQGIFSLTAVFTALAATAALTISAAVCLDLKSSLARKLTVTTLTLVSAGALAACVAWYPVYGDAAENRRNSFPQADAETLRRLDKKLTILVRLAPEDPRYVDFERNILGKLRRTMANVSVRLESDSRSGLFEASSDNYGNVLFRYNGKQAESRSTGAGEVLPLIYGLVGAERAVVTESAPYPGYPLQAGTGLAEVWFYGVMALLIIAGWVQSLHGLVFARPISWARPSNWLIGRRGPSQGDA
jgi:ABC-type transport system involved in multi-copper enzyme maturation permease subunit